MESCNKGQTYDSPLWDSKLRDLRTGYDLLCFEVFCIFQIDPYSSRSLHCHFIAFCWSKSLEIKFWGSGWQLNQHWFRLLTAPIHNLNQCCPWCIMPYEVSWSELMNPLQWRHNEWDGVSNNQPQDCLLNRLSRRRWKKTSKPRVTGLCEGNSPGTGEFRTNGQ